MTTICSFIVFVFLTIVVNILCVNAFPQREKTRNDKFYEEIQNLLSQKVAAYKSRTLSNSIPAHPPKPKVVSDWPKTDIKLGQVTGVSVNSKNQPVIFHRGSRVWDASSFDYENNFLLTNEGPIAENTILTLEPDTGEIIDSWGSNAFYMPHGITIDRHDNVWITDVALHQAFKFRPKDLAPLLEFGERFMPGSGLRHLCKPTSIAVASTGEIFIADGYCNHRVLKFNAAGGLLRIIPNPPEFLSLQVPHGLALLEDDDRICIADRENMRVTCPRAGLRSDKGINAPALTIQQPDMGRVFDIAALGTVLFAVNGPTSPMIPVSGLTIDPTTESVIDHWSPTERLKNPHAIAVDHNGTSLYIGEISPNKIWKFSLMPAKGRE